MRLLVGLVVLITCVMPFRAPGASVRVEFEAVITEVRDNLALFPGVAVGQGILGSYSYDDESVGVGGVGPPGAILTHFSLGSGSDGGFHFLMGGTEYVPRSSQASFGAYLLDGSGDNYDSDSVRIDWILPGPRPGLPVEQATLGVGGPGYFGTEPPQLQSSLFVPEIETATLAIFTYTRYEGLTYSYVLSEIRSLAVPELPVIVLLPCLLFGLVIGRRRGCAAAC